MSELFIILLMLIAGALLGYLDHRENKQRQVQRRRMERYFGRWPDA